MAQSYVQLALRGPSKNKTSEIDKDDEHKFVVNPIDRIDADTTERVCKESSVMAVSRRSWE